MPHSSDAVVDNAEYQDNEIRLNGVTLVVEGPIRGGMVSEFSVGLKVGKATYDEREHAFWMIFEDFSGGLGFRQAEVREAGGTHFDNSGGVDLRRPRHITLPPRRTVISPNADPSTPAAFAHTNSILVSSIGAEYLHIGILDSLFTLDSTRGALTRQDNTQSAAGDMRYGRIIESVESDGTRFLLATGSSAIGSHEYMRSTDGTTWTKSSDLPATPAANASMQLSDAIVWDGLVIAHGEGDQIIGSADGIAWDVDSAGALDPRWRTGDIAVEFIGIAMAPWGASAVYFLSKGKLWVLDWYVYNAIEIQDVGENNWLRAGCMWNGSIFVTDGHNVWEYNPGSAPSVRRIGVFGKDGPPPSWVEQANTFDFAITQFIPGTSSLFALARNLTAPMSWRLLVYNEVGWSWLGSEVTTSQPYCAIVDRFPRTVSTVIPNRFIDVACLDDQSDINFELHMYQLPVTGDVPYRGFGIPERGHGEAFEDGPLSFETGWFDGGFIDLEGALLRLAIDGYEITADETVRVEYRLNNNEGADWINLGTFTTAQQEVWFSPDHRGMAFRSVQFRITLDHATPMLLTIADLAVAMTNVQTTAETTFGLAFDVGDVLQIDDERMLVEGTAGNDLTVQRAYDGTSNVLHLINSDIYNRDYSRTPALKALVLLFDKQPRARTAWTIKINMARTVERELLIGGEKATTERIWQFLKSLVNTPRLINLEIPSLESGGVNVRITDMPAAVADFRAARGGRGVIDLQLIEIAGP